MENYFSAFENFKNFPLFNPNIKYNNINLEENMNQKKIINKIKFEGEYLYGKRWNGKGFNHEGKEVFEIKNGEGLIKEYNNKGKLILEGEYKYSPSNLILLFS